MALSRVVTIGDEPVRLDSVTDAEVPGITPAGSSIAIWNPAGGETVYIGGADVTTTTGAPVPSDSWSPGLDLAATEALYGIVETGPVDVNVLEVGVA